MTTVLLAGAFAGAGVLLLIVQLDRTPGTAAAELARRDAAVRRTHVTAGLNASQRGDESVRTRRLGAALHAWLDNRGLRVPGTIRRDLAVMDRTVEAHLGMSVLAGVAGLFAPSIMLAPAIFGFGLSPAVPLWLALVGALGGVVLTTAQLMTQAAERRRDFRHVVGAYLDLVAMNLAGGRGVPEALGTAASLSDGWGMVRLRDTIQNARLQGITPWAALGDLGDEMGLEELRDLAAALALVAEDGAKVRDSLTARAASMRQRELADIESRAEQQSQSMLIAQLLLCLGFLVFLIFPAISQIIGI